MPILTDAETAALTRAANAFFGALNEAARDMAAVIERYHASRRPRQPSLDEIVRMHVEGHRKAVPGSMMYRDTSGTVDMYPDTSNETAAPKRRRRKSKKR